MKPVIEKKKCACCKETKPSDEFYPNGKMKSGLASWCKSCSNAASRDSHRRLRKSRVYGISDEQYAEMLKRQNGRCAICKQKRKLCIDHCHETGKVRGLLCHKCNLAVGWIEWLGENITTLNAYLKGGKK